MDNLKSNKYVTKTKSFTIIYDQIVEAYFYLV